MAVVQSQTACTIWSWRLTAATLRWQQTELDAESMPLTSPWKGHGEHKAQRGGRHGADLLSARQVEGHSVQVLAEEQVQLGLQTALPQSEGSPIGKHQGHQAF